MRKTMIFLGLFLVSTIVFAQRTADPMERAARQTERMKTELGLNDVQYDAIKEINEKHAAKQKELWGDSTLTRESKHSKAKTLRDEKELEFKKVLTEEQYKKLSANHSVHGNKNRARMAKHQGDHVTRMQKELSLTKEQSAKLATIDKEYGQKLRALRSDSTLSHDDSRAKARKLRDDHQSKTRSVLTEEQWKKWETFKAERKRKRS